MKTFLPSIERWSNFILVSTLRTFNCHLPAKFSVTIPRVFNKTWTDTENHVEMHIDDVCNLPGWLFWWNKSNFPKEKLRDNSRINSSQMRFLRSLSGVKLRDRMKSEEIRKKWNVEEMIVDIQNYQLKWNQHVLTDPVLFH